MPIIVEDQAAMLITAIANQAIEFKSHLQWQLRPPALALALKHLVDGRKRIHTLDEWLDGFVASVMFHDAAATPAVQRSIGGRAATAATVGEGDDSRRTKLAVGDQ
eukprot:CAMPEP_0115850444 /NCGR_PEP_ID=MMETSP0287-20121206/11967_1 /TAXON_ID=412157 /ORGANISM="Chrysochromulina rotalis, Strain UIO044" /LENGTH=105 /DNA_ID=CAMNT_0003304441 /DNA_START=488 /DNA_END=806 /DNA_ORIENTATION=-